MLAHYYGLISRLYGMIEQAERAEPIYWTLNPNDISKERAQKIAACKRLINKIKFKVNELEAKHER
jgi:hypothetical protein